MGQGFDGLLKLFELAVAFGLPKPPSREVQPPYQQEPCQQPRDELRLDAQNVSLSSVCEMGGGISCACAVPKPGLGNCCSVQH
jgi:hypothetical protein